MKSSGCCPGIGKLSSEVWKKKTKSQSSRRSTKQSSSRYNPTASHSTSGSSLSFNDAGKISSLSIFGTSPDQECLPIPVVPRSSSNDELRVWRVTSSGLVEVDAKAMGAFLDKPKTEKTSTDGAGNDIRYGVSSMQGWRICMEDSHITEAVMSDVSPYKDWSFFAVFDGHAGSQIAAKASTQILEHLLETAEFTEMTKILEEGNGGLTPKCLQLIEAGIKKGFMTFDEKSKTNAEVNKSGSTAVCSIVTPTHIIIGNLGDSRAVISRKDDDFFGTEDHKPYLEKEKKRIVDAGGSVMIQRINGSLAVSRAFGDYEYKDNPFLPAGEQLVSPEPDVYIRERHPELDEFMVLACDGVYDVMNNDELSLFVRGRLNVHEDLKKVCDDVLDECLMKGSRDNMTMIVVCFKNAPVINSQLRDTELKWVTQVNDIINQKIDEVVAADGFMQEDIVGVRDIVMKIENEGKVPRPVGTPSHSLHTLVAKLLNTRDIKHA